MKCKAGDHAIIINHRFSGNIGSFVRLKKIAAVDGELGVYWTFEKASKPLMFNDREHFYSYTIAIETTPDNGAFLRDRDLHPIPT